MFFWRISSISLLFSLLLYNFVNCNIYMIARSSLKNNCLYEIYGSSSNLVVLLLL